MLQDLLSKFSSPAEKQGYLLQLTAAHPYFAPAQFSLLQTMQPGEAEYGHRAAIAHLLYNNAHWLQFQLAQTGKSKAAEETALADTTVEAATEETVVSDATTASMALPELTVEAATEAETGNMAFASEETAATLAKEANMNDNDSNVAETASIQTDGPTEEEIPTPLGVPANPPAPLPAPEKEELLFEPLFAVDYFASQGIKLSEEVQHSDKLGKQLKSFTEWLKSMKKTYSPNPADNELPNDTDVQTIAEKSNNEDDVVTEAMAEVFALQGRKQKAAAIYRKLSLLNPHKSAYFAAKIENLK